MIDYTQLYQGSFVDNWRTAAYSDADAMLHEFCKRLNICVMFAFALK